MVGIWRETGAYLLYKCTLWLLLIDSQPYNTARNLSGLDLAGRV